LLVTREPLRDRLPDQLGEGGTESLGGLGETAVISRREGDCGRDHAFPRLRAMPPRAEPNPDGLDLRVRKAPPLVNFTIRSRVRFA